MWYLLKSHSRQKSADTRVYVLLFYYIMIKNREHGSME